MSKIEQAKKNKKRYETLKSDIEVSLNRGEYNKSKYDKSSMRLSAVRKGEKGCGDYPWLAGFHLKFGYGHYGSSDFYGNNSEYSSELFSRAVNNLIDDIADEMIRISKKEMEDAFMEAKEEAKEVLEELETAQSAEENN